MKSLKRLETALRVAQAGQRLRQAKAHGKFSTPIATINRAMEHGMPHDEAFLAFGIGGALAAFAIPLFPVVYSFLRPR